MTTLRNQIIRLAHDHPEIRGRLLPLLKEATDEGLTPASLKTYLKRTGDTVTVNSLAYAFEGVSKQEITAMLKAMVKSGDLTVERGNYSLSK